MQVLAIMMSAAVASPKINYPVNAYEFHRDTAKRFVDQFNVSRETLLLSVGDDILPIGTVLEGIGFQQVQIPDATPYESLRASARAVLDAVSASRVIVIDTGLHDTRRASAVYNALLGYTTAKVDQFSLTPFITAQTRNGAKHQRAAWAYLEQVNDDYFSRYTIADKREFWRFRRHIQQHMRDDLSELLFISGSVIKAQDGISRLDPGTLSYYVSQFFQWLARII